MLASGQFGSDLSAGCDVSIEQDANGNPRILKIVDVDSPDLQHREWYTIRNVGNWPGVLDFSVQLVVQVGDANGDGAVVNLDVSFMNASTIPVLKAEDNERRDIDGDGSVLNLDVSAANARIPSFEVPKPSGH